MSCYNLSLPAIRDCDNPIIGGLEDRLLIANRQDIDSWTFSATSGEERVIESITMKAGGTAFYQYDQYNRSLIETYDVRQTPAYAGFTHGPFELSIFNNTAQFIREQEALNNGRFVIITIGSPTVGNDKTFIRIFGLDQGLTSTLISQSRTETEFGTAIRVNLQTSEDDPAEIVPYYAYFNIDAATSLADIEALKTPTT